jgi:hypothetical protein
MPQPSILSHLDLILCDFQPTLERVLYTSPYIPTIERLCAFTTAVLKGDSRWDSLKRIPYSTPGRYVQVLDLSYLDSSAAPVARSRESEAGLHASTASATMTGLNNPAGDGLRLNGCLNTLLPLMPHLETLILRAFRSRLLQSAPFSTHRVDSNCRCFMALS